MTGAPLGMDARIPESGGVFPPVGDESEQAQLAPELEVQLGMGNYKSMQDDVEGAQQELDRLVSRGFAVYLTKEEAKQNFHRAIMSRLALITKVKDTGVKKHRIISDLLRSGGNDRARVPERIILPRISDVVGSLRDLYKQRLANQQTGGWQFELISADLADAYMHFGVHPSELQNCLAPGLKEDELVLFKAMSFGFKGAPLVMGRLSAAAMRLFQAMMPEAQGQIQCYMDDPPDGSARAGRRAPSDPSHAAVHGPRLWPAIVLQQGRQGDQALLDRGQHRGRRAEQADHPQPSQRSWLLRSPYG